MALGRVADRPKGVAVAGGAADDIPKVRILVLVILHFLGNLFLRPSDRLIPLVLFVVVHDGAPLRPRHPLVDAYRHRGMCDCRESIVNLKSSEVIFQASGAAELQGIDPRIWVKTGQLGG